MSLLLKDRVYTMESPTAKRGVYPLHGYKLGLYRIPIKLEDPLEIQSIHDGLKNTFEMDMFADRIYATYKWKEQNMDNPDADGYEEIELSVTVEIVSGEVVDIIYQIFPIEKFGDHNWVKDYRKKADHYAKMVIDTILRNTILADKMIESFVTAEKITDDHALIKLEEMTPLAQIVSDAKPKPVKKEEQPEAAAGPTGQVWKGGEPKPGPIDIDYKSKMGQPHHTKHQKVIQSRRGDELAQIMMLWEFGVNMFQLTMIFVLQMGHVLMPVLLVFTNGLMHQEVQHLKKNH